MGKAQREKGKRGEREFAALCRENGYDCRRTSQYCGQTGDASDVAGLPGLNIEDAMSQARRDAKPDEIPIVAHRRNNCRWLVTMDAEDWFALYREWEAGM